MTPLAVVMAALASCGYAVGARLQHAAVHETIGDRGLSLREQLSLPRNHRWLLGLGALASGAALHTFALGLAPLSVVQPLGVLALPITVLMSTHQRGFGIRKLSPNVVFAVVACTGGVVAFVMLAAGSATATPVAPEDELLATQLVGSIVLVLAVFGLLTRSNARCVAFAAGCAVAYGYVSLLMRGVAQDLGSADFAEIHLVPVVGIVAAMLVGGWLLQHAYASGSPDLVVACLTVIDPLVAVSLGIGLLGEADRVGIWTALGEIGCAAVACAGVFALARYHPEQRNLRVPSTVTGNAGFAGPSTTDRPDGSIS